MRTTLSIVLAAGLTAAPLLAASPSVADDPPTRITLTRWTSDADFRAGTLEGLEVKHGRLTIAKKTGKGTGLTTRSYTDPFGDGSARTYDTGTWTSPVVELGYPDDEAISSWNATTPTGTWVETLFRGRHADGTWTKWYVMGRWTSGRDYADGDIHRTSVDGQNDTDARIFTDTFSTRSGREPVAFQTRVTLLRPVGRGSSPKLDSVTTMTSELIPDYAGTSAFTLGHAVELAVPPYAQNTHSGEFPEYGGGGEVWCSPTSTAMVMSYFGASPSAEELADIPFADPQVDHAALNVWDYAYDGAGNWPFNAAYAHTYGLDTFVTRLRSLQEVEAFVAAGIPVITSQSWELEEMPEAGYDTNGHLFVIVGFTEDGDPVINDPASSSDANVRSVYTRENFERVWQESTGGVAYIYHPNGTPLPANLPGVTPNW